LGAQSQFVFLFDNPQAIGSNSSAGSAVLEASAIDGSITVEPEARSKSLAMAFIL
jgi:hypothetical protein